MNQNKRTDGMRFDPEKKTLTRINGRQQQPFAEKLVEELAKK